MAKKDLTPCCARRLTRRRRSLLLLVRGRRLLLRRRGWRRRRRRLWPGLLRRRSGPASTASAPCRSCCSSSSSADRTSWSSACPSSSSARRSWSCPSSTGSATATVPPKSVVLCEPLTDEPNSSSGRVSAPDGDHERRARRGQHDLPVDASEAGAHRALGPIHLVVGHRHRGLARCRQLARRALGRRAGARAVGERHALAGALPAGRRRGPRRPRGAAHCACGAFEHFADDGDDHRGHRGADQRPPLPEVGRQNRGEPGGQSGDRQGLQRKALTPLLGRTLGHGGSG